MASRHTKFLAIAALGGIVAAAPMALQAQVNEPATTTAPSEEQRLTCQAEVRALRETIRSEPEYDALSAEFENILARANEAAVRQKEGLCYVRLLEAQQFLAKSGLVLEGYTDRVAIYDTLVAAQEAGAMTSEGVAAVKATVVEVESRPARVAVTPEAAQVKIEREATQVAVQQQGSEITVEQPQGKVAVQQAQPNVDVTQPEPEVDVQAAAPEVEVVQPEPEVSVETKQPQVTVSETEPRVAVSQDEPQVSVSQAEPQVDVSQQRARATTEIDRAEVAISAEQGVDVRASREQGVDVAVDIEEEGEIVIGGTAISATDVLKLEEIGFPFDSDRLSEAARTNIRDAATAMEPGHTAVLVGDARPVGASDDNQALSERRVEAVRQAMLEMGASPDRIISRAASENESENAVVEDGSVPSTEENRRVEIRIVPKAALRG